MFWSLNLWRGTWSIQCHPRWLSVAEKGYLWTEGKAQKRLQSVEGGDEEREAVAFRRAEAAGLILGLSSGVRIDL